MYNEFNAPNRTTWKFTYKGKDLLSAAQKTLAFYMEKESKCRKNLASLLSDPDVSAKDPRITKLKAEVEFAADESEKCTVWVHEFARCPETEYYLSLSDVVYFGLEKK